MHVGCQNMNLTDSELAYLVRHGVYHADFNVDDMRLETLVAATAKAASAGVTLEMIRATTTAGLRTVALYSCPYVVATDH